MYTARCHVHKIHLTYLLDIHKEFSHQIRINNHSELKWYPIYSVYFHVCSVSLLSLLGDTLRNTESTTLISRCLLHISLQLYCLL